MSDTLKRCECCGGLNPPLATKCEHCGGHRFELEEAVRRAGQALADRKVTGDWRREFYGGTDEPEIPVVYERPTPTILSYL